MPRGSLSALRRRPAWPAAFACTALALLASCAGPSGGPAAHLSYVRHRYPPPGPPGDPWGPYIQQASLRFGVPEAWIRAVMRQESGGREEALSSAGAMGLMQLIPDTYALMRARYGLGDDPYEPHDNIMAGTAYIKELYDRYGAPGFLAAYNAGPRRLDAYLASGTPLPDETVGYLASIAPELGPGTQMSGPLAMFAGNGAAYASAAPYVHEPVTAPVVMAAASSGGACDPDAAYDPDRPCAPAPVAAPAAPTVIAAQEAPAPQPYYSAYASYQPAPQPVSAPARLPPERTRAMVPPLVYSPEPAAPHVQLASLDTGGHGAWSIQVGAFASASVARATAQQARQEMPDLLRSGLVESPATAPFGGTVLYRARVADLNEGSAAAACARVAEAGGACLTVPPGH